MTAENAQDTQRISKSHDSHPFNPFPKSVDSNPFRIRSNHPFNPFPESVDSHPFNPFPESVDSHPFNPFPCINTMPTNQPDNLTNPITLTVANKRVVLTREQVLAAARAAMANGLPAEANNYLSWAVEIDDQLVGAKWLFGLATGVSRTAFDSTLARNTLARLGLVVRRVDSPSVRPAVETPTEHLPVTARVSQPASVPGPRGPGSYTAFPTTGPHAILDAHIKAMRDFLAGRASRPSDEKLCDWVHFCYTFELYREAGALFQLVDPAQVDRWQYERTKRLAAICHMKTTGRA